MTDPLIAHILPFLRGYIHNQYRWLEDGGAHCLVTVDDLIQVASIELVHLAARWDDILAERGETRADDPGNRLFWAYLKHGVKNKIIHYRQKVGDDGDRPYSLDDTLDESDTPAEARTALRVKGDSGSFRMIREEIIEFFEIMPRREKVAMGLRYVDELAQSAAGEIFDMSKTQFADIIRGVKVKWLPFTRNRYLEEPLPVQPWAPRKWEPPQTLEIYLRNRYNADVSEYAWIVTECFRHDIGYLVDVLGPKGFFTPDAREDKHLLSPHQKHQADVMLRAGLTQVDTARRLGVAAHLVRLHSKRRHAVA